MVKIVASIGIALAAVACTPPSTRIATGLERYGLDSQRSTCVGQRLERNLSLGQLQQWAMPPRRIVATTPIRRN